MKVRLLFAAVAALAAAAAPLAVAPAQKAAPKAQRDWSRTVVATPEGGFRMGNPAAPVKLIEYVSLTCPHCATFSAQAMQPLARDHVRSGRVSFELRNFVLNPVDFAAALISRCASPQNYFRFTEALLASQNTWLGRVQAVPADQREAFNGLSRPQVMERVASIAGLDSMAGRYGITPARAQACARNPAGAERIIEMIQAANRLGVNGTPSFILNGRHLEHVHDWASLEPHLRAAGS